MTVEELIAVLSTVEDEKLPVMVYAGDNLEEIESVTLTIGKGGKIRRVVVVLE